MTSRTKIVILFLILLAASMQQAGADGVEISEIAQFFASIDKISASSSPVQLITRLRGSKRLLHGDDDSTDDNVTARVSQDVANYGDDNYTMDEWPDGTDINDSGNGDDKYTMDEWPDGTDVNDSGNGDDNYTMDEWPDGPDINDSGNSTADGSEEEEESDIEKWMNSLDPPVRILVSILFLGLFAAVITTIFVALYCLCGITPCDLVVCFFAATCAFIMCMFDDRRVVYY
jgi:hypothetical protein